MMMSLLDSPKESHQAMDVVAMFEPITKWAESIYDATTIPEIVHTAFKIAQTERPGATHIELPDDIAKIDVDDTPIVPGMKARRPVAVAKTIDAAMAMVAKAERPLMLVGNGCARTRVTKQLNSWVDETGIYAAMTFMAKGVFSDRHDKSLFAAGLGIRDHVQHAFEHADLVISIGNDMVEWHPSRWNPNHDTPILHIDFEPAEVDRVGSWVTEAVDAGATLVTGGQALDHQCYAPTLLVDSTVMTNEVFGPVVNVTSISDHDDGIAQANSLPWAFQAALFAQDLDAAMRAAQRLDATAVIVNDHTAFRVDWMPFGGRGPSGIGMGGMGPSVHEMTRPKMTVFNLS